MAAPRKATRGLVKLAAPILVLLAFGLAASSALAASPLKVREVYPGSSAFPAAEFVELQMTAAGQGDIDGQVLRFYDAAGNLSSTYAIPTDVANGQSQRTVLLATQEAVEHLAGLPAPDFNVGAALNRMNPAGGAACLVGGAPADCATWGSIPLATILNEYLPDRQAQNAAAIGNGFALRRTLAPGCPTYLEASDDSANSAVDFAQVSPSPRNNASAPSETRCAPDTLATSFPANPSNHDSATFTYGETPEETGASFECKLDGTAFAACPDSGKSYPGPLAEGSHAFAVRAIGEGGTDPTPKTYAWTVDTIPPETLIDSFPPEPSGGFSAPFAYHSSEPSSSFKCQLDSGPIQTCPGSGKTYFLLADGAHVFRVWATDNAGNEDSTPAERAFTVQGVLIDATPPDTAIVAAPANPSPEDSAKFAYTSNEQRSTFECSLNSSPFRACPPAGETYTRLRNGSYVFSVRAIDSAGNVDSVPATYAWNVAAPLPNTRFTKAPPGKTTVAGRKASLTFAFRADKPNSSFRCRLDKAAFKPCPATVKLKSAVGRHRFEVYAIDELGNAETTPARRIFRVQRRKDGGFF